MKLQIDTKLKTITIEEAVTLGELYDMLSAMFPNFQWKDYLLCPVEKIEFFKDPITIPWNPAPWVPTPWAPPVTPYVGDPPFTLPQIWCTAGCADDASIKYTTGDAQTTYNLIVGKTNTELK
jgi:hypothetical protein